MPFKIENLTNELVLLRCNSGMTLHLAPHTKSEEIIDVEVTNNLKVKKLQEQHVIALRQVKKETPPIASSSMPKKKN
jgi:hypothetical protein